MGHVVIGQAENRGGVAPSPFLATLLIAISNILKLLLCFISLVLIILRISLYHICKNLQVSLNSKLKILFHYAEYLIFQ